jgi:MFS family permease
MKKSMYTLPEKCFIWLKLIIFGVMNFVVFLTNAWTTIDLQPIIQINLGIEKSRISTIASLMYSSFFAGMLVSCFLWPVIVKKISKLWCIIWAFIIVGVLNLLCYKIINIWFIILCRFLSGVFQNIHTVGKDFLFDVFERKYAKKGLILDSCFGLLGHLVAPVIGHWLYEHSYKSFEITCFKISMIFFATICIFYLFFEICQMKSLKLKEVDSFDLNDYKKVDSSSQDLRTEKSQDKGKLKIKELKDTRWSPTQKSEHDDDVVLMNQEKEVVNRNKNSSSDLFSITSSSTVEVISDDSLWSVFKSSFKDKKMRSLMILYGISSACTNSEIIISMLYIQMKWEEQGLGLQAEQVVSLSIICFFPSVVILLFSGEVVPSKISVKSFTSIVILIFSLSVVSLPLLRDFLPQVYKNWSVS